jgi:glycosyltransferase involved in cell wall biosynthesis
MTQRNIKKILVVAKAYPPVVGGVETYSQEVATAYRTEDVSITVITQHPGRRGVVCKENLKVINVGEGGQLLVFIKFLMTLFVMKFKTKELCKYDLIHATTWRVALPLLLFGCASRTIITVHGREVLVVPFGLIPVMKVVLNSVSMIVGVSETSLIPIALIKTKKVVAYNGLSYAGKGGVSKLTDSRHANDTLTIYTFCRLVERKNIQGALAAILMLREKGIGGFRYIIAGSGPMAAELETFVHDNQLEDIVVFLGRIADEEIVPLYQKADIFLHPQIATENNRDIEGFGLTIADAMSFGAVAVAGRDGGPSDFIKHNETGLLVDGNNAAEIAEVLIELFNDKLLRENIAQSGELWVKNNLSWETHCEQIKAHFCSVLPISTKATI